METRQIFVFSNLDDQGVMVCLRIIGKCFMSIDADPITVEGGYEHGKEKASQSRTDYTEAICGGSPFERRSKHRPSMPSIGSRRGNLAPLAKPTRGHNSPRSQAAQGPRERKPAAQEAGSRLGVGQGNAERPRGGKLMSPARRRKAFWHLEKEHHASERRAFQAAGQYRSTQRSQPMERDDRALLVQDIHRLVGQHPRFDCRSDYPTATGRGVERELQTGLFPIETGRFRGPREGRKEAIERAL